MADPKKPGRGAGQSPLASSPGDFPKRRELIVVARPEAGLRASAAGVASVAGRDVSLLSSLLTSEGVRLKPLFGESEEQIRAQAAALQASAGNVPDLSVYYHVDAPDEKLDYLAEAFRRQGVVEAAYVKSPAEPAVTAPLQVQGLNLMQPREEDAPPVTPDFTANQGYLVKKGLIIVLLMLLLPTSRPTKAIWMRLRGGSMPDMHGPSRGAVALA